MNQCQKKVGNPLANDVQREDNRAFNKLKSQKILITYNNVQNSRWQSIFKKIRQSLAQGTFPSSLVNQLEGLAN